MSATAGAPYPPVTSFLWTLLRDLVAALLLSLALAIGWFTGGAFVGPEDWVARSLAFATFVFLGLLSLLTIRALLLRAADTAIVAPSPERSRLLAEWASTAIGLGCLVGAAVRPLFGSPWSDAVGGIAVCLGVPPVLIGVASFTVRVRIAARARSAPGGFDPRELEIPHAWWPLVVASGMLVASLGVGAELGPKEPEPPAGPRGDICTFRELPPSGVGFGNLGADTPYVDDIRSRAECWRLHLAGPGVYRVTLRAERFAPVAILASEPRPEKQFSRDSAHGLEREVQLRWSWDSKREPYLIVGAEERAGGGSYQVLVERIGP